MAKPDYVALALRNRIAVLVADKEALRAALVKYGKHMKQCRGRDYPKQCECGLGKILGEL